MSFYDDSKFHMWRACIGVIWVDGNVDDEEHAWVMERVEKLKFTDEQKDILLSDLRTSIDFKDVLSKITCKKDRAFLVHQIRCISYLDEVFSEEEKAIYKEWHEFVMSGIDLDDIAKKVEEMGIEAYHEDNVYKVHNKNSIFEKVVKDVLKLINPGDYKFPE